MDEQAQTPQKTGGEQRTLASIMFTDVVAFSKHSAVNEERTYRALNRDFDLIYKAVADHDGQVLNTMGDGMMIIFMSPIQCIRCAIAIQGDLYRLALSRPEDGILQHRLGLHLGDIILNGKNTMGDGVNQAARIQALARPEAIAMSREFHDIVVNKTPFTAKYLGPQRAKNIHDAIPIWEISPIDDVIRQQAAEALFTPPAAETADGATGRRSVFILLTVLILLVAAISLIFMVKTANQAKKQGIKIEEGTAKPSDLAANFRKKQGRTPETDLRANNEATARSEVKPPTSLALNASEVADVAAKTNTHDYAGVADVLRKASGANSDDGKAMIKKYDDLAMFQKWLNAETSAATEATPMIGLLNGVSVKIYATTGGIMIDNGTPVVKNLWDFKEATICVVAEAAIAKPPSGTAAPTEAIGWIATFREVHKI